jgi:hypothetical protein
MILPQRCLHPRGRGGGVEVLFLLWKLRCDDDDLQWWSLLFILLFAAAADDDFFFLHGCTPQQHLSSVVVVVRSRYEEEWRLYDIVAKVSKP